MLTPSDSSQGGGRFVRALAPARLGDGAAQAPGALDEPRFGLGAEGESDAAPAPVLDRVQRAGVNQHPFALGLLEDLLGAGGRAAAGATTTGRGRAAAR